jgi:hypothetical protein
MPATTQLPEHPEDCRCSDCLLAGELADAWVARAEIDPAIRRLALRAVGHLKDPADMTLEELAATHGTDRHTLNRIALKALRKLRFTPEIRDLKPQP